jgi:hypothetical protein
MQSTKVRYMPLWADYLELFLDEELSDQEIGQLLRIMLRFYYLEEEPETVPKALRCCWVLLSWCCGCYAATRPCWHWVCCS